MAKMRYNKKQLKVERYGGVKAYYDRYNPSPYVSGTEAKVGSKYYEAGSNFYSFGLGNSNWPRNA